MTSPLIMTCRSMASEGHEITVYIETWFDRDKKFNIDTASDDDTWLNMYGRCNPFDDTMRIECEISRQGQLPRISITSRQRMKNSSSRT